MDAADDDLRDLKHHTVSALSGRKDPSRFQGRELDARSLTCGRHSRRRGEAARPGTGAATMVEDNSPRAAEPGGRARRRSSFCDGNDPVGKSPSARIDPVAATALEQGTDRCHIQFAGRHPRRQRLCAREQTRGAWPAFVSRSAASRSTIRPFRFLGGDEAIFGVGASSSKALNNPSRPRSSQTLIRSIGERRRYTFSSVEDLAAGQQSWHNRQAHSPNERPSSQTPIEATSYRSS